MDSKTMGRTRVGWWPRGCGSPASLRGSCLLPPGLITVLPSGHGSLPSQVKCLRLPRVKLAQHLTAQSGSHIRSQAHPPACTLSDLQWQQPSSQSYWNQRKWDVGKYSKYRLLIEIRPVSSFPREHSTIVYGIHFPSLCNPRISFHLQAITKIPILLICNQSICKHVRSFNKNFLLCPNSVPWLIFKTPLYLIQNFHLWKSNTS